MAILTKAEFEVEAVARQCEIQFHQERPRPRPAGKKRTATAIGLEVGLRGGNFDEADAVYRQEHGRFASGAEHKALREAWDRATAKKKKKPPAKKKPAKKTSAKKTARVKYRGLTYVLKQEGAVLDEKWLVTYGAEEFGFVQNAGYAGWDAIRPNGAWISTQKTRSAAVHAVVKRHRGNPGNPHPKKTGKAHYKDAFYVVDTRIGKAVAGPFSVGEADMVLEQSAGYTHATHQVMKGQYLTPHAFNPHGLKKKTARKKTPLKPLKKVAHTEAARRKRETLLSETMQELGAGGERGSTLWLALLDEQGRLEETRVGGERWAKHMGWW